MHSRYASTVVIYNTVFVTFDDSGYILSAAITHFHSIVVEDFLQLISFWKICIYQYQEHLCNIGGDVFVERWIKADDFTSTFTVISLVSIILRFVYQSG